MSDKCEHAEEFIHADGRELVKCGKFNRNNSHGVCHTCADNTTKGEWPKSAGFVPTVAITTNQHKAFIGPPQPPPPPPKGPGTELMKLIKELGITTFAGCGCASKVAQMNAWGPDGCEKQVGVIVIWLKEAVVKAEAVETARLTKLGQPIPPKPMIDPALFEDMLKSLITKAIENARVAA